jgi:hypothetical protein
MGDMYREILIKREPTTMDTVKKVLIFGALALCLVGGLLVMPLLILVAIVFGIIAGIFILPRLNKEYEYLYVNGELDVDVIYSREKRKKLGSYDMNELEILAPTGSHALDSYFSNGTLKVQDVTSGKPDVGSYTLIFSKDKERIAVRAELDRVIIDDIRRLAPRKVNLT